MSKITAPAAPTATKPRSDRELGAALGDSRGSSAVREVAAAGDDAKQGDVAQVQERRRE